MFQSVVLRMSWTMRRCSSREERGQRVIHVAVVGIEQANHLREIGAQHLLRGLLDECLEALGVCCVIAFDRGGDVLVAKVEHGERKVFLLSGDGAGDMHAPDGEASAARSVNVVGDAPHVVAEQLGLVAEGREHGADGVVSHHLLQAESPWCAPYPGRSTRAVSGAGDIGTSFAQSRREKPAPGRLPPMPKTCCASCSTRAA